MSVYQKAKKLGYKAWIELLFYPVFLLWRVPIAWGRSLWASRLLIYGRWSSYMGFNPANCINNLFYRTQWVNLDRYGQCGISSFVGLGSYHLSRWFHLSLLSSYFYANAGAVTMLFGTLVWVFSHLVWLETANSVWVLLITIILLFSTTCYAMAFRRQNYQVLAWMWMPAALFAVNAELWVLASIAWFAASLAGITAIFFAVPLMFVLAIETQSFFPVIVIIPAVLKVTLSAVSSFSFTGLVGFTEIAKVIGVTKKNVVYKRTSMRIGSDNAYFFVLYSTGCLALWLLHQSVPLVLLTALVLFVVNQRFLRVADEQSVIMVFVSVLVYYMITLPFDYWALVVFWMLINPMPSFIKISDGKGRADNKPVVHKPFDHRPLEKGFEELINHVPKGAGILFAYSDPEGVYEKVFDGYRIINELAYYVGSNNERHIFPDWYAVAESNYEGAKNFWGRDVEAVKKNLNDWDLSYALIYENSGLPLSDIWLKDFCLIGSFDWADYLDMVNSYTLWGDRPTPCWYLIEKKEVGVVSKGLDNG